MYVSEFNNKLNDFVNTWSGVRNGFFPAYTGQCVQLINQYNQDVIGAGFIPTPATMGARDWFEVFASPAPDFYDRIANDPNNASQIPQHGDIVVYGRTWGSGYGHITIVLAADEVGFTGFEQNAPIGSSAHEQRHDNYTGVDGWLRPKVDADPVVPPSPPVTTTTTGFEDIDSKQLITNKPATVWDLTATTWPAFSAVDHYDQGHPFTAVQIYHHPLGGNYYVMNTGEMRGLSTVDADDAPAIPAAPPETAPILEPTPPSDGTQIVDVKVLTNWKETYLPFKADYTATEDYQVQDIAGVQIPIQLHQGNLVHGAGEFKKDMITYVRHQKAVDNDWWYGIPLSKLNMTLPGSDFNHLPGYDPIPLDDSDIMKVLTLTDEMRNIAINGKRSFRQYIISVVATITGFFVRKKINKEG